MSGRFSVADLCGNGKKPSASVTRQQMRYCRWQGSSTVGRSTVRGKSTPCWAPASTASGRPWRASSWSPVRVRQEATYTQSSEVLLCLLLFSSLLSFSNLYICLFLFSVTTTFDHHLWTFFPCQTQAPHSFSRPQLYLQIFIQKHSVEVNGYKKYYSCVIVWGMIDIRVRDGSGGGFPLSPYLINNHHQQSQHWKQHIKVMKLVLYFLFHAPCSFIFFSNVVGVIVEA